MGALITEELMKIEETPCATDAAGNIYLTGYTTSNFGTVFASAGAHQTSHGGGLGGGFNAFLAKFNANGVRQWGTYYGQVLTTLVIHVVADAFGNIDLAGCKTASASGTHHCHNKEHISQCTWRCVRMLF